MYSFNLTYSQKKLITTLITLKSCDLHKVWPIGEYTINKINNFGDFNECPQQLHVQIFNLSIVNCIYTCTVYSFNLTYSQKKLITTLITLKSCDLHKVWPIGVFMKLTSKQIHKAGSESGN